MQHSHTLSLPATVKTSKKIAVIGDVHGESDLFRTALDSITDPERTTLILLGDLIDRGPDTLGCLALASEAEDRFGETIILPGNHEEMLWNGMPDVNMKWSRFRRMFEDNGGYDTLNQFGGDYAAAAAALPAQMKKRLSGQLSVFHQEDNLLFVHAGLNPNCDTVRFLSYHADTQFESGELSPLWVRRSFYGGTGPYKDINDADVMVVYGHTRIGAKNAAEMVERVDQDVAEWRIPMDASGSGGISVLNVEDGTLRLDMHWDPRKQIDPWDAINALHMGT